MEQKERVQRMKTAEKQSHSNFNNTLIWYGTQYHDIFLTNYTNRINKFCVIDFRFVVFIS